jgi:hypothetical protein
MAGTLFGSRLASQVDVKTHWKAPSVEVKRKYEVKYEVKYEAWPPAQGE